MKSILDYPSQRLATLIKRDPLVAKTHKTFNTTRRDEDVLVEQLIIDQAKVIQKLKDEILTLHTCNTAIAHVTNASKARIRTFTR